MADHLVVRHRVLGQRRRRISRHRERLELLAGHGLAGVGADGQHAVIGHDRTLQSARAARQQSWNVEKSGAGANRTTSGGRASHETPWSRRSASTIDAGSPGTLTDSWLPRCSGSRRRHDRAPLPSVASATQLVEVAREPQAARAERPAS